VEPKPAEPSISKIEMDLLAEPPLRADAEAIADQQHPDHQLGIDRRTSDIAVEACKLASEIIKLDEPVYRPEQMIRWNVPFQRELIEQRSLFDLPMSHHERQSCINRTESLIFLRRNCRLVQHNRLEADMRPGAVRVRISAALITLKYENRPAPLTLTGHLPPVKHQGFKDIYKLGP